MVCRREVTALVPTRIRGLTDGYAPCSCVAVNRCWKHLMLLCAIISKAGDISALLKRRRGGVVHSSECRRWSWRGEGHVHTQEVSITAIFQCQALVPTMYVRCLYARTHPKGLIICLSQCLLVEMEARVLAPHSHWLLTSDQSATT